MDPAAHAEGANSTANKPNHPLCGACCVGLTFDDKAAGGSKATPEDGNPPYLVMPGTYETDNYTSWYYPQIKEDEALPMRQLLLRDHAPEFPRLEESALQGCFFCDILYEALTTDQVLNNDEYQNVRIGEEKETEVCIYFSSYHWKADFCDSEDGHLGDLHLYVAVCRPTQPEIGIGLIFRLDPCTTSMYGNAESILQWLRLRRTFSGPDRFNAEDASWAKRRIQESIQRDPWNNPNVSFSRSTENGKVVEILSLRRPHEGVIPKRLVDVRSHPPKLVVRSSEKRHLERWNYAALSYCWGPPEDAERQLKTTKDSLAERMRGIPEEEMTPSLRDAVNVTRALSIPYLWVDALCILQGSDEEARADWESEALNMDRIYQGSHVTLAALASSSCQESFIRPQERALKIPWDSNLSPTASGRFRVSFVDCQGVKRLNQPLGQRSGIADFISYNLDYSHWLKRGWTFQEGLMSRRILAFTDSAIIFFGPKKTLLKGVATPLERLGWHGRINQAVHEETQDLQWIDIAIGYSARHGGFTRRSDFLPGLSGIAAWYGFRKRFPANKYLAGLWNHNLYYGLAWSTNTPPQGELEELLSFMRFRENYVCPTWSWGLLGNVNWPVFGMGKPMCSLVTYVKRKEGKLNEFGEPEFAEIKICGRVVDLPSDLHRVRLGTTGNRFKWQADVEAIDPHGDWIWELDWAPAGPLVPRGDLKMVLTGSDLKTQKEYLIGIILHPVRNSWSQEPNVWCVRVGSFRRLPKGPWVIAPSGPNKGYYVLSNGIHKHLPVPFFGRQENRTVYIV
ncbi:hypothetical protein MAPG_04041 [Magnaporthiopsis poae ATCC 64411]|uniref:Heterokaryon incompatibility domain-containing protein n=1 Tax=Magnaporthiopsis poae (strain ATCC 64411 / 73-15) TaxID=644358 RepID=A0A0C4DVN2_MAGP6|nr:hypothetical protein MAPG_04041 [Magnaporthiopsis poae ATCC 64411]